MTERLVTNKGQCVACIGCIEESNCKAECGAIDDCLEKLAEYETAEEEGRLYIIPQEMNVGDRVYEVYQFLNEGAQEIDVHKISFEDIPKLGKTVFLSKDEAQKALENMKS